MIRKEFAISRLQEFSAKALRDVEVIAEEFSSLLDVLETSFGATHPAMGRVRQKLKETYMLAIDAKRDRRNPSDKTP